MLHANPNKDNREKVCFIVMEIHLQALILKSEEIPFSSVTP
jgi:hypothetical protein